MDLVAEDDGDVFTEGFIRVLDYDGQPQLGNLTEGGAVFLGNQLGTTAIKEEFQFERLLTGDYWEDLLTPIRMSYVWGTGGHGAGLRFTRESGGFRLYQMQISGGSWFTPPTRNWGLANPQSEKMRIILRIHVDADALVPLQECLDLEPTTVVVDDRHKEKTVKRKQENVIVEVDLNKAIETALTEQEAQFANGEVLADGDGITYVKRVADQIAEAEGPLETAIALDQDLFPDDDTLPPAENTEVIIKKAETIVDLNPTIEVTSIADDETLRPYTRPSYDEPWEGERYVSNGKPQPSRDPRNIMFHISDSSTTQSLLNWQRQRLSKGGYHFIIGQDGEIFTLLQTCLLYTSPSPRDRTRSRMPSSA